jgi:hypothetical protein
MSTPENEHAPEAVGEGSAEAEGRNTEAAPATGAASGGDVAQNRSETDVHGNVGDDSPGVFSPHDSPNPSEGSGAAPGSVVDASLPEEGEAETVLTPEQLEELNKQIDRQPGDLPPGVNALDPLHAMSVFPDAGNPAYTRWLEGLVEVYRHHTVNLRAIARRVGAATPELPHYPDFKA